MGATLAVVGEYFGGAAAVDAGTAAATEAGLTAAGATAGEAATAGALQAGAGAAGAGAAAGGGLAGTIGTAVATASAGQLVGSLLSPKAPGVPKPQTMPDPLAQQQATQKSLVEQLARRGRASTILTDTAGSGKLGG